MLSVPLFNTLTNALIPFLSKLICFLRSFWFVRIPLYLGSTMVVTFLKFVGEVLEHVLFIQREKDKEHQPLSYRFTKPISPSFVKLEDGETCYFLLGPQDGPLVILLHGFSFYSVLWNFYAENLVKSGYQVLIFDFYGQGFSEVPSPEKSKHLEQKYWKKGWELLVVQTDQLLHHLKLADKKSVVIGHSMGGLVAAKYTAQFPERVKNLILLNPVGSPCHIDFLRHPFSSALNVLQTIGNTPILGEIVILGIGAGLWLLTHLIPPDLDALHSSLSEMDLSSPHKSSLEKNLSLLWTAWSCQMQQDSGRPRVLLHALRHLPFFGDHLETFSALDQLNSVQTFLIWGLSDSIFPPVCLNNFLLRMPRARKALLPDTNHSSFLERPWIVLNLIQDFLGANEPVLPSGETPEIEEI